ncbi:hypothetical protein HC928_18265 [bacterium]|nr:hypothetical protein [bacterium]
MKIIKNVHVLAPCDVIGAEGIQQLAASYNADEHEAPVCIGHPKDNSPAFGWVRSLTESEGDLYADLEVQESFYKMLEKGLFKKRSVSFYDSAPPVFRHLGFLGARPPHVKGLKPLELGESDLEIVSITENLPEVIMDLKPETLYMLSDKLPGVSAKSFKSDPIKDDSTGIITGIVNLSDEKEYSYSITPEGEVKTELLNEKTIELSERVKTLEAQLTRNSMSADIEKLHQAKLTPQIISLDDCVDLVINDGSGRLMQLLKNLPDIVDMAESAPASQDDENVIDYAKRLMESV